MTKYKLNVLERIMLRSVLKSIPGSYHKLKLINSIERQLQFDENELKLLKMSDNGTRWDREGDKKVGEVNINVDDVIQTDIIGVFKKLDKEEKLTRDLITLYEKFIKP